MATHTQIPKYTWLRPVVTEAAVHAYRMSAATRCYSLPENRELELEHVTHQVPDVA